MQAKFNYTSPYWSNNETYAVDDGLEGLTAKQTKLASYWNTQFNKICLGMKANNVTKWIATDHEASSLFDVIANGNYISTSFGKEAWKFLIDASSIQPGCNREVFKVPLINNHNFADGYINVRIGIAGNNEDHCINSDSCIAFGISLRGCDNKIRPSSCGDILARCTEPQNHKDTATFGFLLVQ